MSKQVKTAKVTPKSVLKVTLWLGSPGVKLGSSKRFILRYLQEVVKNSTQRQSKYELCDYGAVSGEHQIGVVVLDVVAGVFGFLEKIHHQVHLSLCSHSDQLFDDLLLRANLDGVLRGVRDNFRESIFRKDNYVRGLEVLSLRIVNHQAHNFTCCLAESVYCLYCSKLVTIVLLGVSAVVG
jgi:hypothetical protein